jgi:hypothetical protein
MKTDELVTLLSTNLEPVDRRSIARTLCVALAAGSIVALGLSLVGLGMRSDLTTVHAFIFLVIKLAFAFGIVGLASVYLTKLARPGGERKTPSLLVIMPFVVIVILAGISLALAPSSHWEKMIAGDQWLECLISIPIIAIVPFAISMWVVRRAAPTDLARAGAFAGLAAGGVSAMAYALHCTDDSLPFIAVWYGGTIVLCTLAGVILGPRLLRW